MIAAKPFETLRGAFMAFRGWLISFAVISAGIPVTGANSAPLPPPPPGAIERAMAIVVLPKAEGLADYVRRFAEDVVVIDSGKKVAANRDEFLAYLRARPGMHVRPLHISYGNPILVAENVDNFPERRTPNVMQDCCTWARVSSYHLNASGMVDRVLFLRNGSYWGPPEAPDR